MDEIRLVVGTEVTDTNVFYYHINATVVLKGEEVIALINQGFYDRWLKNNNLIHNQYTIREYLEEIEQHELECTKQVEREN